jgi:hypothetical protein
MARAQQWTRVHAVYSSNAILPSGADRIANCFGRYDQFNPSVLLPARGVIVPGYWQRVAKTSRRH